MGDVTILRSLANISVRKRHPASFPFSGSTIWLNRCIFYHLSKPFLALFQKWSLSLPMFSQWTMPCGFDFWPKVREHFRIDRTVERGIISHVILIRLETTIYNMQKGLFWCWCESLHPSPIWKHSMLLHQMKSQAYKHWNQPPWSTFIITMANPPRLPSIAYQYPCFDF